MRKPSYAFPPRKPQRWAHGQRSRGPVALLFVDVSLDNLDKILGI